MVIQQVVDVIHAERALFLRGSLGRFSIANQVWQLLIFHLNGPDGIFCGGLIHGSNGDHVISRPVNVRIRLLHNFYRLHTGHPLGGAGVDAHDFRVRIGTTEHLAIEHAGTMDIVGILRLSRDFDGRIDPCDALADQGAVVLIGPCVVRHTLSSFL